jgi:KDO2-lipid IV(A) lauroyltransferase
MRRPTFRHRIEHLGYRVGLGVLGVLPQGLALRVGEVLGWVVGVLLGVRRRVVLAHLRQAFPDRTEEWRRRLSRASFRHLGRESLATFLLGRMSPEDVLARTEVDGLEALRGAVERGRGAVVITAHFGNWEIAGAALALRGIPLDVVVQRQRNPFFNDEINRTRERLGMVVIPRNRAPREVLRSLRQGRAVAIVGDQNVRRGGVFVDFFGRKASTARGAAVFALRTGCAVFLGVNRSFGGYPVRYRAVLKPVPFEPTGDMEEDILRLTEIYTRYLEGEISRTPEQYFWQHRRWKTRPPGE